MTDGDFVVDDAPGSARLPFARHRAKPRAPMAEIESLASLSPLLGSKLGARSAHARFQGYRA
jgi:hypothetical protein